jgi:hypothetical protein
MNIFYVDKDAKLAARSLCDKHVVKMIVETAQLLSTAHRVIDGKETEVLTSDKGPKKMLILPNDIMDDTLYQATHVNHPSAKWVRESVVNYFWLLGHFKDLLAEYTFRYGKIHKCNSMWDCLLIPPKGIRRGLLFSPPPCCMPTKYIVDEDTVINYRMYYRYGKKHLHKWTKREKPDWI